MTVSNVIEVRKCKACQKVKRIERFMFTGHAGERHKACIDCRNDFPQEQLDEFRKWLNSPQGGWNDKSFIPRSTD